MADNTINYGFPFPEGGDRVAVHSDVANLAKAVDAHARVTGSRIDAAEQGIEDARFDRTATPLSESADLGSIENGIYSVRSGTLAETLGLPVSATGIFRSVRYDDTAAIQVFETRSATPETWQRSQIGTWRDWVRTDGTGARWLNPPATTSDTLDTLPEGVSPVRSSAVGEALTLPVQTMGYVEKTVMDSAVSIVKFSARRGTGAVEEYTISTIGGVWQEWKRSDAAGIVIPDIPDAALGHVNLWGSSTPSGLASYLGDSMDPYSVAVHSHARGGQWSSQTTANTSMPIRLPVQGGTIPGSGSVEINAADSMLDGVDLYLAPTNDGIPGWLGGVYGRLVGYGTTFAERGVRFERDRPGSAVSLSEQPEWIADVRTPGHMNIINAGKNDLTVGPTSARAAAVIERRDALVQMWRDRGQDFLILGQFVNTGTGASATGRTWVEADNADALSKYPDNYLSMQDLCTSPDVWDWTGITPTSTDLAEQALGNLPPSIAGNANHFNATGYRWVAHNIQEWLLDTGRIGAGRIPFGNRPAEVAYLGDGVYEIN